jgi:hypothetical protein
LREGITVIIPTIGRVALADTIRSFIYDLTAADDVIVLADGPSHSARNVASSFALGTNTGVRYLERKEPLGHWGHPLRNKALEHHVETTHVWTIDDDDIAALGAIPAMRDHMGDPWTIFRMHFGAGHPASGLTLPNSHQIRWGNIGTPMIFAPWTQARFGHHYSGDLDYAQALYSELGEPVWASETIAIIQPDAVPAA